MRKYCALIILLLSIRSLDATHPTLMDLVRLNDVDSFIHFINRYSPQAVTIIVNCRDGNGNSLLHYAARFNAVETLRFLLTLETSDHRHLRLWETNRDGQTVEQVAIAFGSHKILNFLHNPMLDNVVGRLDHDFLNNFLGEEEID
jgi:ankyrin repeat protein